MLAVVVCERVIVEVIELYIVDVIVDDPDAVALDVAVVE